MHSLEEFFGYLYHLNTEEEPENPDYPKDPRFREKFGPRGVKARRAPIGGRISRPLPDPLRPGTIVNDSAHT
jgi:hypothetical protein